MAYGVSDFMNTSNSYEEFQSWFNKKIYLQQKRHKDGKVHNPYNNVEWE